MVPPYGVTSMLLCELLLHVWHAVIPSTIFGIGAVSSGFRDRPLSGCTVVGSLWSKLVEMANSNNGFSRKAAKAFKGRVDRLVVTRVLQCVLENTDEGM